jgi:uncharacterized membrane protein
MELKVTANEYAKGVNEMTEQFKKKFGELVFDEDVDADVLDLIKSMFGMIDVSTRLVVQQAKTIQEINDKLDKLLGITS